MSDCLQSHGLQHTRLPWPSLTPTTCSNSRPSSRWCHPSISSSVIPLSSCPQSFPASGSLPVSQFFISGGQSIGVSASASVLPMNIQNWFPLEWTGLISLKSYDQPREHIIKQKHYFANKGPYSQGCVFSSSHVWMWELDHKEGWVLKNSCFWTVVLEETLESP